MDILARLRKIEKPLLFSFIGLWGLVYICSRFFLVMYTDRGVLDYWLWIACTSAPFSIYAAWRTVNSSAKKWLNGVGRALIFSVIGVFAIGYIIINGDILLSSAFHPGKRVVATVVDVQKVFKRKLGFDHTSVTVLANGREITMEARPYAYFYLQGKLSVKLTLGKSNLQNDYVTSIEVSRQEKIEARWLHFTEILHRLRLLWALLACFILAVWIIPKSFLKTNPLKRKPLSVGKQIGITIAILFGLGLLFYLGVLMYALFVKGQL